MVEMSVLAAEHSYVLTRETNKWDKARVLGLKHKSISMRCDKSKANKEVCISKGLGYSVQPRSFNRLSLFPCPSFDRGHGRAKLNH